jgi:uncharacterized protein (TIGR02594 family)
MNPFIRRQIRRAANRYGIPSHILAGLIDVESDFNPGAVSSAGAGGLTQFIPSTARAYGVKYGTGRRAMRSQIMGAAHYLSDLGGTSNIRQALGNYYGDPSSSYAQMVLDAAKQYKGLGGGAKLGQISAPQRGPQAPPNPYLDPKYQAAETMSQLSQSAGQLPETQQGYQQLAQLALQQATAQSANMNFGGQGPAMKALPKASNNIVAWAARQIGVQEGSGKQVRWAKQLGLSPGLPWCSIFVAAAVRRSGLPLPGNPAYSGSWLDWGRGMRVSPKKIRPGDIVIFDWGDGGITDHVAIYAGGGQVIGGNQSNAVTKVPLNRSAIVGVIRLPGRRGRRR